MMDASECDNAGQSLMSIVNKTLADEKQCELDVQNGQKGENSKRM